MSLTREHIIAGVRDGCWSHSSGQDILDLWDRMKDAEGRAEKAERERDDLRQEYHELFELNRRNFADLLASQAREQELKKALTLIQSWTFPVVQHVESWQPVVKSVDAALTRPSDTSALRELLVRVVRLVDREASKGHAESVVAAVLGAPTSLERK